MADILGFQNIIQNTSGEEQNERINAWKELIAKAGEKCDVRNIQLISDTVFASINGDLKGLQAMINFSKFLLTEGIKDSLPIRGAITYGDFEWGDLTYGKPVVRAHEIERSQNWIGVTCDGALPHLNTVRGVDSVIQYPAPMKSGVITLYPVIVWDVPEFSTLVGYLTRKGLVREGEIFNWYWAEKVTNTIIFSMYRRMLVESGETGVFLGLLPIQIIEFIYANQDLKIVRVENK